MKMNGLAFLYPAFLFGALTVAVPIVLHLLKREAAPLVPFSAVRFLKRAPVEQTRRKRIREWLLLALRVSALLLLAGAFARPYLTDAVAGGSAPVSVIAVDTSLSMSAPGTFDRARDLAREAARRAPAGDLVALLAFDDGANPVVRPSADRGSVVAMIDRLTPSYGGTNYGRALAEARALIGSRRGRIALVTDLQRRGWETDDRGAVPARVTVEVLDAGMVQGNLAVGSVTVEDEQAAATLLHWGSVPASVHAWLEVDGRRIGEITFSPSADYTNVTFPAKVPRSGAAVVRIEDRLGYQGDNERFAVLGPPAAARILVIGNAGDTFYVERALNTDTTRFLVETVRPERFTGGDDLEGAAAVVLTATRGIERRGRDALDGYVRGGGGMLVASGGDVEAAFVSSLLGEEGRVGASAAVVGVSVAVADPRHPVFRPLGVYAGQLGAATFKRISQLHGPLKILARFSDGSPALVERSNGRGRVLLFASDLANRWNDLPLHPTFVPLVHETIRYVMQGRERTRELLVADAPAAVERRPGVVLIPNTRDRVALNVDTRESNPTRLTAAEFRSAIARLHQTAAFEARVDARTREEQQSYWRYGLMVMLVALALEGLIGRRTT
ncbi:MAG: BatA domain-containing protein [Acidobacteria bacterium]|nr:BatA domain-containing protein [Acidobacteriota bacterium]